MNDQSNNDALIGFTGFVGSNLLRQKSFSNLYRSTNIEEIRGKRFDLLVCSGARAEKWKANLYSEDDAHHIEHLIDNLKQTQAKEAILISTVDVYPTPIEVDESVDVYALTNHAYGKHRAQLEMFFRSHFPVTRIIRLPGLFGQGIKKNIIHDFLHDHETCKIDSRGRFQFYPLRRIWNDLQLIRRSGLELVNFATEPVSVADVAHEAFKMDFKNEIAKTPASYDFKTRFSEYWGHSDGYIMSREEVLAEIQAFVTEERGRTKTEGRK